MDLIRLLWSGDMPLRQIFWKFGAIGGIFFSLQFNYLNLINEMGLITPLGFLSGFLLCLIPYLLYFSIVSIGVWRSANRYLGMMRYQVLAKMVSIMWIYQMLAALGVPLR